MAQSQSMATDNALPCCTYGLVIRRLSSNILYWLAGTFDNEIAFDVDNISNFLSQSPYSNTKLQNFQSQQKKFDFNGESLNLFFHVNISSLQNHEIPILLNITNSPSFISETRIYKTPLINVNIPAYTFVHFSSPTEASGAGAYVSRSS